MRRWPGLLGRWVEVPEDQRTSTSSDREDHDPSPEPTTCCRADGNYCDRCDLLVGLDGLRVIAVDADGMVIGQFTATGHDLGNARVCAADLAITYMDGQPDGLV
ncbi:hypothetical protein [Corynebacterium casei]|uniref:hypothetical protein n=1 Tax=Corynebacterium casei TaxID=160386 RepID=UPI002649AAE9|nr:hypothetical protein [Corynebacterium casei]MDN6158563.1 hypothetical protein [Brevibacterium sp.]MDN5728395.1 hypothetical protein [Corynebacterium casei]MDN5739838.1 hypothetical protein [Corynebacterium casei]MDN5799337.1 hypothetical protein [Corynebacterium casei]MDN5839945.1 hypothetical protein [Corynebacterium casei]